MATISNTLGVGSGIDTQKLVSDLVAAQRAPRDRAVADRTQRNQARISALGQLRAGLSSFAGALTSLANSGSLGPQPASSDATTATIRRTGTAPGPAFSQAVEVTALAQAQVLSSRRFTSATEPVGLGSLSIEFGTADVTGGALTGFTPDSARAAKTLTIDSSKDSLSGLRDAINASGTGLSASIVNDGAGVRLQVRGQSGAANAFRITASPTPGSPAGTALGDFSFLPGQSGFSATGTAANARLVVDGLPVERASNSITDLVPGYTVDLQKAAPGTTVRLSAERNSAGMADLANSFVEAYNSLRAQITAASKGRTADGDAGPLFGQSAVRSLSDQLAQLTARPLATGSGSVSLADIGIKTQRDGTLALDSELFQTAIDADPTLMERLFAPSQSVSTGAVSILSAVGAAKPGSYAVTNARPATSGSFTGTAASLALPVVIDPGAGGFTVELDGAAPLPLSLASGSYASGESVASAFESAINDAPAVRAAGSRVRVGWDGSVFRFVSTRLGQKSAIAIGGLDSALATSLGLATGTSTPGTAASGEIGGVPAVGNGSRLIASASSAAAGLSLDLGAGVPAGFSVTIGEGLSGAVARMEKELGGAGGTFSATQARFDREAKALTDETTAITARSTAYSDSLTRQFTAMERAVASYKSIGSFLTQQIDSWNNSNKR